MTDTLVDQRNALMTEIRDLAKAVDTRGDDFTDDERATITDRMGKARDLQTQITKAKTSRALANDVQEFLSDEAAKALNDDALADSRPDVRRIKSLGEYFTDSDQFKKALAPYKGKNIPDGTRIQTDPVNIEGGLKALLTTTGNADGAGPGQLYDAQRLPTVMPTYPALKLRNVVTVGTTGSDAVTYARVLRVGAGSTSNAAGVPEAATAAAVGSGNPAVTPVQAGVKPESALGFSKQNAAVITIAHWLPATKKALSDAGQLATLIDNFLRVGLDTEVERQILFGDSDAGEEFDGLANTDGIQTQAFDTNILVTIRKALTKVRRYGTPNAVLVSPGTAERIDLLRTSTGQYLGGGAFGPANPTVWRVPLVEVPAMTDGSVYVGDFTTAVLWDREEASVTASDSHADFFIRNLVAILAEARAAFGVLDPALIAKVAVTGDDDIVPAVAGA